MRDSRWENVWGYIKPFDPLDLNNFTFEDLTFGGVDHRLGKTELHIEVEFAGMLVYSKIWVDSEVSDEDYERFIRYSLDQMVERIDKSIEETQNEAQKEAQAP